jgi:hypothetical protein
MSTLFGKSQRKTAKRHVGAAPEQNKREKAYKNEVEGGNIQRTLDAGSNGQNDFVISKSPSPWSNFDELGLAAPLVQTCRSLGFQRPSAVQRRIIPFLIRDNKSHVLALAATGSGKVSKNSFSYFCALVVVGAAEIVTHVIVTLSRRLLLSFPFSIAWPQIPTEYIASF